MNYLQYLQEGGKNRHKIYLDGKEENSKSKSRDLMFVSDIQELLSKLKNSINEYYAVKKNLPQVSENTSTFTDKSPIYHINRFRNREVVNGLPSGELSAYFRYIDDI